MYEKPVEDYERKLADIQATPIQHPGLRCINLGCGPMILDGWTNVDKYYEDPRVVKADIDNFPYPEGSCDVIFSSHSLEHMPFHIAQRNLDAWGRWLKPGGRLCLAVPDLENQMRIMLSPDVSFDLKWNWYIYTIFGYQADPNIRPFDRTKDMKVDYGQIHYCGFSKEWLIRYINNLGMRVLEAWTYDGWGTPSIYLEAVKL